MPGLVLKLRPDEEVLINGVLLQNSERGARLTVKTPNARILRLRDAMAPADATTPMRRACFQLQLAVAGEPSEEEAARLGRVLDALLPEARLTGHGALLEKARIALDSGNHYAAWRTVRQIVEEQDRADPRASGQRRAPGE